MTSPIAKAGGGVFVVTAMVFGLTELLPTARACPFCTAVSNTFSEDFAFSDAVVFARLTKPPAPPTGGPITQTPALAMSSATFSIDTVLKGEELLGKTKSFTVPFFGDAREGDLFLFLGSDPKKITWQPPMRLDKRRSEYIMKLTKLPKEGAERLAFFQPYLRDEDELLSRDAFDEFARAPYESVKALKPKMNHAELVGWIQDPKTPVNKLRLYLTMLGVCGGAEDLPMLEERMRGADRQARAALDATIACYLTLRGPEGVVLVEDLFLKQSDDNFSSDFADVYAAIMALRFHGEQNDVIPRARVLKAFHILLDNPPMADLIVADLARWEDWSQLERLAKVFKEADEKSSWIRQPIIHYVRACPRPEAKKVMAEFEKIDPKSVKRAFIMPFGPSSTPTTEKKEPAKSKAG